MQLYIGYRHDAPFGEDSGLFLQAGRFTMNLGSRRLVASDDYRNTTNGYTGLYAEVDFTKQARLSLYYTLPQVRLPLDREGLHDDEIQWDRESRYLQLWGLLLSGRELFADVHGDVGYVGFRDADSPRVPTRDRELHTLTARLYRDPAPGRLDFEVEGLRQVGRARTSILPSAPWQDVSAWAAHLHAGYRFDAPWKPRLALEYAFASGDGPGASEGRFDTLYGMRTAEFGPSGIYGALGRTNIRSLALRLEAAPGARLDGQAVFRTIWAPSVTDFFSTSGVRDPAGESGSFAGHSIETRVRAWVVPRTLRAELILIRLLRRGLLRDAPNAPPWGDTTYTALSLTYTFGAPP